MNIYVIGIGLIGGSMVLDIKALYPEATIYGIDSNENHLQEAIALGVVDEAAGFEDLANCRFCNCFGSCRCCACNFAKSFGCYWRNTRLFLK